MADFDRDSMTEMFTFEMSQLMSQLEQIIIQSESGYTTAQINEIFRITHTIKGSAAMMMYDSISKTAHSMEDLFYYMREESPRNVDYHRLTDLVLAGMDFIKEELGKVENNDAPDGDGSAIIAANKIFLEEIKGVQQAAAAKPQHTAVTAAKPQQKAAIAAKPQQTAATAVKPQQTAAIAAEPQQTTALAEELQPVAASAETRQAPSAAAQPLTDPEAPPQGQRYKAAVFFEEGSEMENIRAYNLLHRLEGVTFNVTHIPDDILDEDSVIPIRKQGFIINFESSSPVDKIEKIINDTVYLKSYTLDKAAEEKPLKTIKIRVRFSPDCEMENIRAYALAARLREKFEDVRHQPEDLVNEASLDIVRNNGVEFSISTDRPFEEIKAVLESTPYIRQVGIGDDKNVGEPQAAPSAPADIKGAAAEEQPAAQPEPARVPAKHETPHAKKGDDQAVRKSSAPAVISVNVSKLDQLLNLVGELVIAEAMVTQNPELDNLALESFYKEARQLRKIIKDLQETIMSMRMVPLSTTFFKMHRIVRDMCRQLGKDVQLEVIGEETEVDKNIIEHISDPIMHIIRNSIDHGIEMPEERRALGKGEKGTVTLEAKNTGGDVLIIVKDDGAGLDRDKILKKAKNSGLLKKPEAEYTEKEIQQFIFLPGFSTNDKVTSYSGRGVGMDVVSTNLELVGGSVLVDSAPGQGSAFTLKIPLTLAIIDGMTVKMGGAKYTIPIVSIKQSFKAGQKDIFTDPNGNEMISTRGEIYNVIRLYEFFGVDSDVKNIEDGILIMLENGDQAVCILADELVGEQQVVVKSIPKYFKKTRGISGCTLLGNGEISLIVDVAGFFDK